MWVFLEEFLQKAFTVVSIFVSFLFLIAFVRKGKHSKQESFWVVLSNLSIQLKVLLNKSLPIPYFLFKS